ncbi:hypothetical protein L6164_034094 [Bauhinia variegata]|uniref:Uncharacterized protein n=1 Tax=Bauhinia variegata TaxID=167791 RepID=A0ACB9KTV7_BAUVA|nr:hypothetical protein L6164_034094 [Bauhinia variegata]
MDLENIDWDNIDSVFVEDDTYENFDAPKWVDFSASDEIIVDDEDWFCNHDCKHPNTAENFGKPTSNSKVKRLRIATIPEILPFRKRNGRDKRSVAESSSANSEKFSGPNDSGSFHEDSENKNPNFSAPEAYGITNKPKKQTPKPNRMITEHLDGSMEKENPVKPKLRSTFSARNLLGGREVLSQITEFCSELKRIVKIKKGSKKGTASGVSAELKETMIERERIPLLVVKDGR